MRFKTQFKIFTIARLQLQTECMFVVKNAKTIRFLDLEIVHVGNNHYEWKWEVRAKFIVIDSCAKAKDIAKRDPSN